MTCAAVTFVVSGLVLLTQRSLLTLFTSDPAIIELAVVRVSCLMYGELINVVMDNLSGALRGLGKSMLPAVASFVGVCGTRITWVFTGFKLYHTWLSLMLVFPISRAITAVAIAAMYIHTRNKLLPIDQ
jgi:Na+-driven multidrug efflux pump